MFGCSTPTDGELIDAGDTVAAADTEGKADSISFTTFSDDIGSTGTTATRKVFTSASGYKSYFGHAAPSTVDFHTQWVVFYSAGTEPTGSYTASIESVSTSKTGLTLKVTTSLTSPGPQCIVPEHVTKPFVLATIKKQPQAQYVQFSTDDQVKDCGCIQKVLCIMGDHFDNDPAVCACVPDVCIDKVACMVGYHWDSTPGVCKCVPDGTCATDADCTLSDNYCGGCACDALGPGQTGATCSNPVNCIMEPCQGKAAWCNPVSHACEARPSTGIACGTNHCGTGEYCCNSSCGICAKMGQACIQIACGN